MKTSPQKIDLSWETIQKAAGEVADQILAQCEHLFQMKIYGIPRGGNYAACLLQRRVIRNGRLYEIEVVEDPLEAHAWVDDILDSGKTYHNLCSRLGTRKPLFVLINKKTEYQKTGLQAWYTFPWERSSAEDGPQENVRRILQFIGEDVLREGLKETPDRVVKSWDRLYGGYQQDPKGILKTFQDGACDEMVILRDVEFYSTCEHHMLPFFGKAHIGYLPDKKIVGISKLARLLEVFSRRLQIQERMGQQITDTLMEVLQPKGCGCVLEAQHFCMTSRGVEKQNSIMVTSSMRGSFRAESMVRSEFLRMVGK